MAEVIAVDAPSEIRAIQRRKFGDEHDSALLKEVIAFGAHVCKRGSQMEKFDAIAAALNKGGVLSWSTDAKHCLDRYKLLIASFKRDDRARASASGTEEEFCERDQLLSDIVTASDDANERGRIERLEMAKRDKDLLKAGEKIRSQAMSRRGSNNVSNEDGDEVNSVLSVDDRLEENDAVGKASVSRKRKRKCGIYDLEETLEANESKRSEQEDLRLNLERERLEFEKSRADKLDNLETQRIELMARQQQDNTKVQMKMMSVMEEVLRKLER
jgi:hypothetical protein